MPAGFLFSRAVARELGDWPFHMLAEDIEFTIHQVTRGRKIAFCADAVLYDEQPTEFSRSWRQRMRWSRGYLQVFRGYGLKLVRGMLRGSFSCFDMTMTTMPAFILSAASLISNLVLSVWGASIGDDAMIAVHSIASLFGGMYLTLFVVGAITTATEWKPIRHSASFTLPSPRESAREGGRHAGAA